MNDDLDTLLREDLLRPPADFTHTVMQRIARSPLPTVAPRAALPARWRGLRRAVAAVGLIGGGLLGLSQLAGFVFGLWVAGAAL